MRTKEILNVHKSISQNQCPKVDVQKTEVVESMSKSEIPNSRNRCSEVDFQETQNTSRNPKMIPKFNTPKSIPQIKATRIRQSRYTAFVLAQDMRVFERLGL
jgi:hypothetical protein